MIVDVFPGTFITYIWEAKLLVRQKTCEKRLAQARTNHTKFVEWRNKYTPQSNAWQQYDAMVRAERDKIERELDEMQYIKGMSFSGPIVGGYMHIPGENGYQGPSIIDLFHRVADAFEDEAIAKGIRIGLEILTDPYKFLNDQEREGYDLASKIAEKASEEQQKELKRGPGRPKGSKNQHEINTKIPEKVVLFRLNADGEMEAQ